MIGYYFDWLSSTNNTGSPTSNTFKCGQCNLNIPQCASCNAISTGPTNISYILNCSVCFGGTPFLNITK